ncbi:MAG: sigma-70 family RNA polymerase sigma factor [Planctomycetaceae bacterium]|nr:sigma-70 family RNA polymerase sigma factor [Planctomycetaceae bacterium]
MGESEAHQDDLHEKFLLEFTKIRKPLYAYIFSLLPNRDDAEDVFQRTSLILWRKIDQFVQEGSFFSWSCGVAFYEVRNFLRVTSGKRLQFRDEFIQQLADERGASLNNRDQRYPALQNCLQKLQKKDRELIDQVYSTSDSIQELAELKGKAVQSLYNRLNLLRGQLAECIQRQVTLLGESS